MKKSKLVMIGFYVAVLFVLLAVVAVIFRFTNGGTDDFKTFYVQDENHSIFATTDTVPVYIGAPYEYSVDYTFEKFMGQKKDFSVKVLLNTASESYKKIKAVGDTKKHSIDDLNKHDFSKLFNLAKVDGGFIFGVPYKVEYVNDYFANILDGCYSTNYKDMTEVSNLFKIVVTSYNGQSDIVLTLNMSYATPDSIEFDNSHEPIIFG